MKPHSPCSDTPAATASSRGINFTVQRATPPPPPVESVTITLSAQAARSLMGELFGIEWPTDGVAYIREYLNRILN